MTPAPYAIPAWEHYQQGMPLLDCFESIGLAQLGAMVLMDRVDTKYVLPLAHLPPLLAALADGYWALQVEGVRLNRYQTLYFDTAGLDLYASHHVGRSQRYKVRSRSYLDSGAAYFEVKQRTNKGRTLKARIATGALLTQLTPEAKHFVAGLTPPGIQPLQPSLWNAFSRFTLASKRRPERVTIDVGLCYWAEGRQATLPGVAIAEVKQERVNRESELIAQMRALGIRPTSFSKYCVGIAMLYPDVKHNRFKPILRTIDRVMEGGPCVE